MPNSKPERVIAGRLADAFEAGDIVGVVALLTDDAWLTMPPEPYEYQLVLTLEGDQIPALTWFPDSSAFPQFGLPRMLRMP